MLAKVLTVNNGFFHAAPVEVPSARIFVHQNECDFRIENVATGDIVDIESTEQYDRGLRGFAVTWVERPAVKRVEGVVVTVNPTFAFVQTKEEGRIMAHIANTREPVLRRLRRGTRVRGVIRATQRGDRLCEVETLSA